MKRKRRRTEKWQREGMEFKFTLSGFVSSLIVSTILFLNSIVILNQQRFLSKIGIQYDDANKDNEQNKTVRGRLSYFFYRTQDLARYPLIFVNACAIVFLLIFG
ncbi:hypothetical protein EIN_066340 [Entamoeba invadens IP1]|uniref:Uncharacterized protein n=1 Tax=Entamoeba invadens IP1 TaxID=370355 RepID=A0A0A1TVC6_ENTIV|nr:hypothetical protein EIN_066340 [Entamoeba invadens IP1]ELP84329.1 hypothetical protein EIN_066340 [Entamoeba invadens IP1]|eukprot:XP_004183675.1 hypothetical protein EIN_066340 [Entamoeba invadens IP1]